MPKVFKTVIKSYMRKSGMKHVGLMGLKNVGVDCSVCKCNCVPRSINSQFQITEYTFQKPELYVLHFK